ncbi:hypothetical protein O4H61_17200 [Roseovarius aestuarii]|nr:hypothetical protein [Roseovarius aestuarii]
MTTQLTLKNLIIAGLVGEIVFEAYAWLVSPALFGVALSPTNLVVALGQIVFGASLPHWAGFAIHATIGSIGFAVFVWLTHLVTKTNLILSGVIAGLALWFIAQGLLAPVVGRSFMMGFGAYTQSSFIGHVGMTTVMAIVLSMLSRFRAPKTA